MGEQVVPIIRVLATFFNHLGETRFEQACRLAHALIVWRGDAKWQHERRGERANGMGQACIDRSSQFVSFAEEVGIKEDLADDAHCEANHRVIDVDDRAILPLLHETPGVVNNGISVAGNVAWLKTGGHQLALPPMECSFADEEPVIAYRFMHEPPFGEIVGILNQDVLSMLSLIEKEQRNRTDTKTADISLLCQTIEKTETILQKLLIVPDQEMSTCKGNRLSLR